MDTSTNCSTHDDRPASWYCWSCGLPFCEECVQPWNDQYLCDQCYKELEESTVTEKWSGWPDSHREAGPVTRLLAFFIDFSLITLGSAALTWLFQELFLPLTAPVHHLYWGLFYAGILVRDAICTGGSPGKRLVGLYVWHRQLDRPGTLIDSVRRNIFLLVFMFDVLLVPFSRHRQRVGDYLAGTIVCDRRSRSKSDRDLYRLAGVILFNLLLLLSVYTVWLRIRTQQRQRPWKVLGERDVTSENIVSVLRNLESAKNQVDVRRTPGGEIRVSVETDSAEDYHRLQEQIRNVLVNANYRVTEESDPELVFRGRGVVRFQYEILASPGKDDR